MSDMLRPILAKALRHPARIAITDDQRRWRYLDLVGGALHLARHIKRTTQAKHIGIMLPTSGAFPMAVLAAWLLDRVIVPINYLLSPGERQHVVDDSGIDTLITARAMLEYLGDPPNGVTVVKLDELKFTGIPPLRLPPIGRPDDRLAAILYTSGTSGTPKGVMLTHRNLLTNVRDSIAHAGLREADGFIGVLPQFHCFGLTALTLIPLYMGAHVIYSARFVPTKLVKLVREHRPEVFMAIPAMYHALANLKNAGPDDFKSIRLAVSGAEPLSAQVRQAFLEKYDVKILEGYGLTETSPVVSWSLPGNHKDGAVGPILPHVDVQIIDPEGNRLRRGEQGEVIIKGPNVMAGYYNMPEQTDDVIDADGYFHTGDMGMIDAQGLLHITGRIKEMMIIGGENVFPREIEEVLSRHPSVAAAGVIGRQDPSRGEVPVAFVEIVEGEDFDADKLRRHCREHLAGFKVPKAIHQIDELPRSPTGKVLRRELRGLIEGE